MVFMIDDDQSVRKSLERLLGAARYKTELFTSASEFLSRSAHPGPSCIVIDVRMPGLNGIDFQNVLIENNRAEHLIFITGIFGLRRNGFRRMTHAKQPTAKLQAPKR